MSDMPGTVAKGRQLVRLDDALTANPHFFEHRYATPAQEILALLEEAVRDGILTSVMRNHIAQEWLAPTGYWSKALNVAEVLQRGLYWAVRLARYENGSPVQPRAVPLPVRCVWICAGPKEDTRFEIANVVSDHQVTLLLLTPAPEKKLPVPPGPDLQPVWATRSEQFPLVPGEVELERWDDTRTVRPLDFPAP